MNKYTFLEKIGRGTHGTVYLLQHNEKFFVCKTVSIKHTKYAQREIGILQKINHKNIIKLVEHVRKDDFYIVLEYANHGTLEDVITYHKKNNIFMPNTKYARLIWQFLSQISDALFYLKAKRIMHRDIKPSNILLQMHDDWIEFKLCDFSLSTVQGVNTNNLVGTPFYMAPEIITKETYDEKVDMWSLGVCLYEMVEYKRPFNGKTRKDLQKNIVELPVPKIEVLEDTDLLCGIINRCLIKNQKERLCITELRRIDRIKYCNVLNDLKLQERKIAMLETRIKELESGSMQTPKELSIKIGENGQTRNQ